MANTGTATAERRGFSIADLPVSVKILAAVGVAGLVALVVGISSLTALGSASSSAQRIYRRNVGNVAAVGNIKAAFLQVRVDVTLHAATTDPAAKAKIKATYTTDAQAANDAITAYRDGDPAGDKAVIDDLANAWQQFSDIASTKLFPLSERGDIATWQQVRTGQAGPQITQAYQDIDTLEKAESTTRRLQQPRPAPATSPAG